MLATPALPVGVVKAEHTIVTDAGLLFRQLSIYQHIHIMPVVRQKRLAPALVLLLPHECSEAGLLAGNARTRPE